MTNEQIAALNLHLLNHSRIPYASAIIASIRAMKKNPTKALRTVSPANPRPSLLDFLLTNRAANIASGRARYPKNSRIANGESIWAAPPVKLSGKSKALAIHPYQGAENNPPKDEAYSERDYQRIDQPKTEQYPV